MFVDNVLFPRMILPLDSNCILTNETHSDDVVKYCDTNDDGKADNRRLASSCAAVGRPEPQDLQNAGPVSAIGQDTAESR